MTDAAEISVARIAVIGILLESNVFAPLTHGSDFKTYCELRGEELVDYMQSLGFDEAGSPERPIEIVPILVAMAESGGAFAHEDYLAYRNEITERLSHEALVDGVFIFGHGAGQTTRLDDLDGDYFAAIRQTVGPDVPIVAELDLHANLSDKMVEAVDMLVGYRTNPHVDVAERARECGRHILDMLDGKRAYVAYTRLPLVTAQIAQLTAPDTPYGIAIAKAEDAMREQSDLANVTLLSGFTFGDTSHNGFAVCVSSWRSIDHAKALCLLFGKEVWSRREDFKVEPHTIASAVEQEAWHQANGSPGPRIYADIADNPGGGGRGNTIHLLKEMAENDVEGVQASAWYDPHLVKQAVAAGEGRTFHAQFNVEEPSPSSGRWNTEAKVEKIFDGRFVNQHGVAEGETTDLGASCLLSLCSGRIHVVVVSLRNQVFNPQFFTVADLDPTQAKCLIVKSRGHFRAGFSAIAADTQVVEVDGPGLVTASIADIAWKNLPSRTYPTDPDTPWVPMILTKPETGWKPSQGHKAIIT